MLFFKFIVSVTITLTAEEISTFFSKIKGGSLIVNLILLGKCDLRGHPLSTYSKFSEKLTFLTP